MFPEGTDFGGHGKVSSDRFARKNNLPTYDYVLHPRTTGFQHTVQELGSHIDSIVDVCIGYPVNMPCYGSDLSLGHFPKEVHFMTRRYPLSTLPKDADGLSEWCKERWAEKEDILKRFYEKRSFAERVIDCDNRVVREEREARVAHEQVFTLVWVSLLLAACWYLTLTNTYFVYLLLVLFAFNFVINHGLGGLSELEIALDTY